MRKRLSVPLLLFAVLLAWALLSPRETLLTSPLAPAPEIGQPPDSYAVDVIARDFDDSGALVSETVATELRRFRKGQLVELTTVQRRTLTDGGDWIALADTGELYEGRNVLELRGNVTLRYPDEGAVFRTDALLINLDRNTARSLAPVRGEQGDNSLQAEAMFLNLNARRATFSDGVRSHYAPPS